MNQLDVAKRCLSCGMDVTQLDSFTNSRGEHWCVPCYEANRETPNPPVDVDKRRCVCCFRQVERVNCHKNRYGEYVCITCREAGKRRSWRRTFQSATKKGYLWIAYGGIAVVGVWLFFKILARLTHLPAPE